MKKIIILALAALMMVGCYQAKAYHDEQIDLTGDFKIRTITYQDCEYVVIESSFYNRAAVTHKGNCRFCKERRQKELEELVIKIKEK